MKTALDSSVLLDVIRGHGEHAVASREALRAAYDAGALVASDVVWAEVRAGFPGDESFLRMMDLLGVGFEPIGAEAAALAGMLWGQFHRARKRGERSRERIVADFLIGAHARLLADALLTRYRGFFREYFEGLKVIEPSEV